MNVAPLELDLPARPVPTRSDPHSFAAVLGEAAQSLERADAAETSFAERRGGLQEAVIARAKADVMLQIATSAASRTTQALSTILNIQV